MVRTFLEPASYYQCYQTKPHSQLYVCVYVYKVLIIVNLVITISDVI